MNEELTKQISIPILHEDLGNPKSPGYVNKKFRSRLKRKFWVIPGLLSTIKVLIGSFRLMEKFLMEKQLVLLHALELRQTGNAKKIQQFWTILFHLENSFDFIHQGLNWKFYFFQ